MVMKVRMPKHNCWSLMIEGILPRAYNLKRYPLHKYVTLEYAQSLYPNITFTFLVRSKSMHALDYDNSILIHPDCFIDAGKRKLRSSIRAALRAQYSL